MVATHEREAVSGAPVSPVSRRGLIRARFAYRRGQGLLLAALAALMMIAIVGAPLYERLVEQESMQATLANAGLESRGASVARALLEAPASGDTLSQQGLRWFRHGVSSFSVPATFTNSQSEAVSTSVTYRTDQCQHLAFAAGRCPTGGTEAAVSSSAASAVGLHLGDQVDFLSDSGDSAAGVSITVVGFYRPFAADNDYWFGHQYSSTAGVTRYPDFSLVADNFFTSQNTVMTIATQMEKLGTTHPATEQTDFALIPDAPGVDDIDALRAVVAAFPNDGSARTTTQLPFYLDQVENQRRDVLRVVVLTAAQLALLAAIAFGVVVAAAADQRKQEFALARLRGRSPAGTTAVFTRELALLVLAAAVPGVGLAWLAVWWAGRSMTYTLTPEARWPAAVALVVALVVAIGIVVSVGARQSRLPVGDLLREVPPARARRGVTALETAVGVLALAGLVAAFQGGRGSVLGTLTPTFFAALAAIVVVRLTLIIARWRARKILRRGSLVTALAAFSVARRPGGRLLVTLVCLATALAVFTAQQWSIAASARDQRAQVDVGAAAVLQVDTPELGNLRAAVRDVNPDGSWATPVVTVNPPNADATPLLAVDPGPFSRIASWGRNSLRPTPAQFAALAPAPQAPQITVRGDTATLDVSNVTWKEQPAIDPRTNNPVTPTGPTPEPYVSLEFFAADGRTITANFGPLPTTATDLALTTPVDCASGCRLISLGIARPRAGDFDGVRVAFDVVGLSATSSTGESGTPSTTLGTPSQWESTTPVASIRGSSLEQSVVINNTDGRLQFVINDGGNSSAAQYLNQPIRVPALMAGTSDDIPTAAFETLGLYASPVRLQGAGRTTFAPRSGAPAYIVNLDLVRGGAPVTSAQLDTTAHASVWSRYADASHLRRLTAALQKQKAAVTGTALAAQERDALADTGPALSSDLALVVGAIAELLALGLLFLIVITSRRPRQRDLAALRLLGMKRSGLRRATSTELITLVIVGVVAGAVAGIAGAIVAVPGVPIFAVAGPVPIPTVYDLQIWWLVGTVVLGVVVLTVGAWIIAGRLVRRRAVTTDRHDAL